MDERIAHGSLHSGDKAPIWVIISCALAISLGTYLGGWRVIRTLGKGAMGLVYEGHDPVLQRHVQPWLIHTAGNLPWIGNLFKYKNNTHTKSELVIFLRPVVMRCLRDAELEPKD